MKNQTKNYPLRVFGVHDPLSSTIAQNAGADALWLSSYSFCASQGYPDLGLLPFTAELTTVSRIVRAVEIPVVVDIDNGYGSAAHAKVIAANLAECGVYGVCIEDKSGSKASSLYSKEQQYLLNTDDYIEILNEITKVAPNLKVWARLEGLNYGQDINEIDRKIAACLEAKADCVVIHNTSEDISKLLYLVDKYQNNNLAIIPTTFIKQLNQFNDFNLHAVIYANQMIRAQMYYTDLIAKSILNNSSEIDSKISSVRDINKLVNYD